VPGAGELSGRLLQRGTGVTQLPGYTPNLAIEHSHMPEQLGSRYRNHEQTADADQYPERDPHS
jgi:hypothetical protein